MSISKPLITIALALSLIPEVQAGAHCPGNAASLRFPANSSAKIIAPVWINQAGPFDFVVDTGTQVTSMDPALASELKLKLTGEVGIISPTSRDGASIARLDRLEALSQVVENPYIFVLDERQIQAFDRRIRGVLGLNFLSHFDLLIDNRHRLLCLDETQSMRAKVLGEHIPLAISQPPERVLPFTDPPEIAVQFSGGQAGLLLLVDSGADGPFLFARTSQSELPAIHRPVPFPDEVQGRPMYAFLPPRNLRIGHLLLNHVQFAMPAKVAGDPVLIREDGILPTAMFERVFLSFSGRYIVLDPG